MSVDAELLDNDFNSNLEENQADSEDNNEGEESLSLRELVKKDKAEKEKKEKKNLAGTYVNPIKKWSATFLRQSWYNIIPSYGLSFFGVLGIIFLRAIFGKKYFCRLGDELSIAGMSKLDEKEVKMANIVEPPSVFLIAVVILLAVISIISLFAMLAAFITSPLEVLKAILKYINPANWK